MAPKILLLNISPNACLLECELAAQKFIVAANAVFLKAQGLATLAPLHEMVFGLLEVHQACINLWSLNKQAPWAAEFGKTVVSWEHAISTIEQIKLMHFEKMAIELKPTAPVAAPMTVVNPAPTPVSASPSIHSSTLLLMQEPPPWQSVLHNKGKGKVKVMEDDDDEEEAAQKFRKELEDFVVLTICNRCIANNMADHCWYLTGKHPCWCCYRKSKGCLWNGVSVRTQKKRPPLSVLVMAKCVKLVQAAKAFLEQQGKLSQFFVLEGYKGKGKAKALLGDSEQVGAK
ncbi:hypothetical protein C0995_012020 [Termitomyces sp. Mi166|nr:hypothetical protein C0995_012020 [Termitomyces sp. Mi166\